VVLFLSLGMMDDIDEKILEPGCSVFILVTAKERGIINTYNKENIMKINLLFSLCSCLIEREFELYLSSL
jgi:hypothetical protein